jgi:hypothetical protein
MNTFLFILSIILIMLFVGIILYNLMLKGYLFQRRMTRAKISLTDYLLDKYGAIDCSSGKCVIKAEVEATGDISAPDFVVAVPQEICPDGSPEGQTTIDVNGSFSNNVPYTSTCLARCPNGVFIDNVCYGYSDTVIPGETANPVVCNNSTNYFLSNTVNSGRVCRDLCLISGEGGGEFYFGEFLAGDNNCNILLEP